jgi:acyl-CoA thioesterase-1
VILLAAMLFWGCGQERPAAEFDSTAGAATAEDDADARTRGGQVPRILFLGDSITAGYGLDPGQAFPALVQAKLDSLGYRYEVVNGGLSGETTAGGLRRIDWLLQSDVDILLVELGGNDGLRGFPPEVTRKNLIDLIVRAKELQPNVRIVLGGLKMPPNMGSAYTGAYESLFPSVAAETGVDLIPFILEGVGGVPEHNLPDGIHPNEEGHQILAETVWAAIESLLTPPA